jgi:hypothetical protein
VGTVRISSGSVVVFAASSGWICQLIIPPTVHQPKNYALFQDPQSPQKLGSFGMHLPLIILVARLQYIGRQPWFGSGLSHDSFLSFFFSLSSPDSALWIFGGQDLCVDTLALPQNRLQHVLEIGCRCRLFVSLKILPHPAEEHCLFL